MKNIFTSIQYLKGVGPQRVKLFNRLEIYTIRDLFYYFPHKYLDRSKIKKISEVLSEYHHSSASRPDVTLERDSPERAAGDPPNEKTIQGEIVASSLRRTRSGKTILETAVSDQTGIIYATWFNQPYLKTYLSKGQKVILSGRLKFYDKFQMVAPEYEIITNHTTSLHTGGLNRLVHTGGIIPCYSLTEGLYQKFIRRLIKNLLEEHISLPDIIEESLAKKYHFMHVNSAINQIHFPDSHTKMESARKRFIYEELFLLQVALALRRNRARKSTVKYQLKISDTLDRHIRQRIPFTLTGAQEKVIKEIKKDLISAHPMNRLLQGDVGSGKTVVAIYAALAAIGNKTQVALMAPTEILAEQHYQTISRLLTGSQVKITLLTSGLSPADRKKRLSLIKEGPVDLVIGTHSLIQDKVIFHKLSLLIIDEQHKFGVVQRAILKAKGAAPHMLVMTATPSPGRWL